MNRSILGRAVFSAAVVLGLGFGLREAAASSPAGSAPYCSDTAYCTRICQAQWGPGAEGTCIGNRCYCI